MTFGYVRSFADYTPSAARNNVTLDNISVNLFHSFSSRLNMTGTYTHGSYEGDTFTQDRDMYDASGRFSLFRRGRLSVHVGGRAQYFTFSDTNRLPASPQATGTRRSSSGSCHSCS